MYDADKMNCRFELVVPCKCDISSLENNQELLEVIFSKTKLNNTSRLKGSVLLDEVNSPIVAMYELKQEVRTTLGLHGNENHIYTYVSEDTEISISKIKLWVFKSEISFVTMNISINKASKEQVLDIVAYLCNICTQKEDRKDIVYEENINLERKIERSFTVKTMLKKFFSLPGMDFLKDYRNDTYNRARCLFYGTYYFENMEERLEFLEMLRLQSKSSMQVAHGAGNGNLYEAKEYLSWAVSPYVLCGVGDLKSCGKKNIGFLTDKGGLEASVIQNYLPIYLNCLSVGLALDDIKNTYNVHTTLALRDIPKDVMNKIQFLHNIKIDDLTDVEEPINKLFREYVCNNALGISEMFRMLQTAEGCEYQELQVMKNENKKLYENINKICQEMKESNNRVVEIGEILKDNGDNLTETIKDIGGRTKKIQEEVHNLNFFVRENLVQYISQQKKELCEEVKADLEKNEIRIAEALQEISGYINEQVSYCPYSVLEKEKEYLKSIFGEIWHKLMEESRTSLISASVLWKMCSDVEETFDYSCICILVTSALENELQKYFWFDFQNYLTKKYGVPSESNYRKTFKNWPEILLSISEKKYQNNWRKYQSGNGNKPYIEKKDAKHFTLGTMQYLFDIKSEDNNSKGQDELLRNRLNEYLATFIDVPSGKTGRDIFISGEDNFIARCGRITKNYRNRAAHAEVLSKKDAEGCYEEVIGKIELFNYTSDITGILLELYQYMK